MISRQEQDKMARKFGISKEKQAELKLISKEMSKFAIRNFPKGSSVLIASCLNCNILSMVNVTPEGINESQKSIREAKQNGNDRFLVPILCPECGKNLTAPIFKNDLKQE